MIKYTGLLLIPFVLNGTSGSLYGQWEKHTIDQNISESYVIEARDIENDGDMDLFVSEFGANRIVFYENINLSWTEHVIDAQALGALGLDLADIDSDGKLDVLAGNYRSDVVAWYRNEGGDTITWEKNTIDGSLDGADVVVAEDINGDGAVDAIALGYDSGEIVWYENKHPAGWTRHIIGLNSPKDGVICVGDITGDNKPDVIRAAYILDKLVLYKNNLPGTNWTEITIDGNLKGAHAASIDDIDNDGDMDIVVTSRKATDAEADVAWYENDGTGQNWTKHGITADLAKARGLATVDLDGDEDKDLVVTDIISDNIVMFLNEDGGQSWTEHTVCDGFENLRSAFAFDVDQDGDIDLLPTSEAENVFVWFENPLGSAFATSLETFPFLIQSSSDTLTIQAMMYNPDNHHVNAFALITGDQSGFVDTLPLFDDGLHGDGDPSDNVWGNIRLTNDLPEDEFLVELFTYDSTYGDTLGFVTPARFITLGPVELVEHSFITSIWGNDITPHPGDFIQLKLILKNTSSTAVAKSIAAELISLDTLISLNSSHNYSVFQDIPAGESSASGSDFWMYIAKECPGDTNIAIVANISSYGQVCWQDTFYIYVQKDPTTINDDFGSIDTRIYPNPVNDLLTIETGQPGLYFIQLTSLNGQLLYSDSLEGPTYRIDLSPFQKGIYLITVRSKDFIEIRKLIKMH